MVSKSNGFTLVEVIVVAVIVAILAAVAIPSYLGYVTSTRQDAVTNLAQTAASAASIYFRKTNNPIVNNYLLPNSTQLNLVYNATTYSIIVDPSDATKIKASVVGVSPPITSSVAYR